MPGHPTTPRPNSLLAAQAGEDLGDAPDGALGDSRQDVLVAGAGA